MLAIFTGLLCIVAGIARLGFITELLSKPIRYGYMNGIALTVLVGQLPKLFGFSVDGDGLIQEAQAFIQGVLSGKTNLVALAIGGGVLLFILLVKRYTRFPGVLLAVVVATLVTAAFDLAVTAGLSVVGSLPQGLPSFTIPAVSLSDLGALFMGAVAIAVVAFADTSVLSRTYAARLGEKVNPNQEMIGLGFANLGAGFFQGFADQQQLLAHTR